MHDIKKILYFYKESCESIQSLKDYLATQKSIQSTFSKKIPDDFLEFASFEKSGGNLVVFDDFYSDALTNETLREIWLKLATVYTHHHSLVCMVTIHSYEIFLKASKLNGILQSSSHLIFFKTTHDQKALKRIFSHYEIKLKNGGSLWGIYKQYVMSRRHAYLILCISQLCQRATAFSNVLLKNEGPLLSFHQTSSDEDE